MDGVDAGVQQLVRRCRAAAPAGEGLPDARHQQLGRDQVLARGQQPVQAPHPVGQGPSGDLPGGRPGHPPRRHPVQQRVGSPGEFRAQCRHGVAFDGRAPGEADVLELAHRGARPVAADEVTPSPPGALGPAGVRGDPRRLLLDGVDAAVDDDAHQPLPGEGLAQRAGQHVLGEVQRGRLAVVERDLAHHLLAPQGPPSGPAAAGLADREPGQPLQQRGGVLAQDDAAREPLLVLAGALVQDDGGDLLAGQCQGQREPDGPRPDDDHRVHGAAPPARNGVQSVLP